MIRNIFYIVWKQKKLVNETKHGLVNCCKYGSASGRVEKICRTGLESGSRVSCGRDLLLFGRGSFQNRDSIFSVFSLSNSTNYSQLNVS